MKYKLKLIFSIFFVTFLIYQFTTKLIPEDKIQVETCLKNTKKIIISYQIKDKFKINPYTEKNIEQGKHIASLINNLNTSGDNLFEIKCNKINRKIFFSKKDFSENIKIQNIIQLLR